MTPTPVDPGRVAPRGAAFKSLYLLIRVTVWTLLATTPTRADDPSEASVAAHAAHSAHARERTSVPDCPHCQQTGRPSKLTETPPVPMIPEIPTESSASRSAIPMIPTTTPAKPTTESEYLSIDESLFTSRRPALAVPSQRPQRVPGPGIRPLGTGTATAISGPNPAGASAPAGLSPGDSTASSLIVPEEEPKLPELPDDLKDQTRPAMPGPRNASNPTLPALQPPAPGIPPGSGHLGTALVAPREGPAPSLPSTTKPDLAIPRLSGSEPAPAIAGNPPQGPSIRILSTTPLRPTLAMPPPAAAPLGLATPQENMGGSSRPVPVDRPADEPLPLDGFSTIPVMIGDQSPASLLTGMALRRSALPGQPPTPPSPFARMPRSTALVPWSRGFKIAENQSPMPQDRVFYSFNYFNNMNGDVNRRLGSPITDMQVYRQLLGIEKTFWRGNASVGLRLPIDTLWTNSADPSLRHNSTSVGDLTLFTKFLLYDNPTVGSLLSGGLAVTAPTGPASFAGSSAAFGFRNAQIQPFLGYLLRRGDFYLQGFSAIDIPTDSRDVTMWYNDLALGYFVYQSADPSAFLSAVVPTFELHLNDPLNHRGALRPNDPAGTPDVLDLTFGSSFIIRQRLVATLGCSFPVTGPRPFEVEAVALLNFYYGRYGTARPWPTPPASQ